MQIGAGLAGSATLDLPWLAVALGAGAGLLVFALAEHAEGPQRGACGIAQIRPADCPSWDPCVVPASCGGGP